MTLLLVNLLLLGEVFFYGEHNSWSVRSRSEIRLSKQEKSIVEKEEGSKMMDLVDYLPLKGMNGFIWDDQEACIRMEGLIRDAQHWVTKRDLQNDVFGEEQIQKHLIHCSMAEPETKIWFSKVVDFLLDVGHPQSEILFVHFSQVD